MSLTKPAVAWASAAMALALLMARAVAATIPVDGLPTSVATDPLTGTVYAGDQADYTVSVLSS